MDLTPGYHLTLGAYDVHKADFVACVDLPELASVAFLQYDLADDIFNLCLDVLHLPTGVVRRAILDGPTPGASTTVAAMRSIGGGRLLLTYQTGGSEFGGSSVYLQVVDAAQVVLTIGDPAVLFNPATNDVIPNSRHMYNAPPGVHQVTTGDFVACYFSIDATVVPPDGVYSLGTFTCRVRIAGTQISVGEWTSGLVRRLTGTPAASCASGEACPLWVDEAAQLTALIGPEVGGGAGDVVHLAAVFVLRFSGSSLVAIDHTRLRAASGYTLEETWSEPCYAARVLGFTSYMDDLPLLTSGRRLYACRLGGAPAEVARTTEFGTGLRDVLNWYSSPAGVLDSWRSPSGFAPDIWQAWNTDETEIIYRFRAGNFEVAVRATELQSMPGSDLGWVYADPDYGGVYDAYPWMVITASGYFVAYNYGDYGVDDVHVSVWRLGGLSSLAPGQLTTAGFFS